MVDFEIYEQGWMQLTFVKKDRDVGIIRKYQYG
jgi:hypothetical protein